MNSIHSYKFLLNSSPEDLFILDIDSTLVTTHQRNQSIIETFIETHEELSDDWALLKTAQCQLGDYGLHSALKRIGMTETSHPKIYDPLMKYWRQHFFSNDFLSSDLPTEGAVEWVQKLREQKAGFVYLTARHKESMWPGTLTSMQQLGFPINENILFLKEDLSHKDDEYKSLMMQKIMDQFQAKTYWLIDNEPVVLHRIQKDYPQVQLVWFESCHSGRMEPPANIPKIQNFLSQGK